MSRQPGSAAGSGLPFRDRHAAGIELAAALARYRGQDVVVLGIPRGGLVVAAEVARQLDAELDIVVARKLDAPIARQPAIGAVTADGERYLDHRLIHAHGVSGEFVERVAAEQIVVARRHERRFRGTSVRVDVEGRVVILVDDGVVTGTTMRAAIRSVRAGRPARIVIAVPVGPIGTAAALCDEADDALCLYEPEPFLAIGVYYQDFAPVADDDVARILGGARQRQADGGQPNGPSETRRWKRCQSHCGS